MSEWIEDDFLITLFVSTKFISRLIWRISSCDVKRKIILLQNSLRSKKNWWQKKRSKIEGRKIVDKINQNVNGILCCNRKSQNLSVPRHVCRWVSASPLLSGLKFHHSHLLEENLCIARWSHQKFNIIFHHQSVEIMNRDILEKEHRKLKRWVRRLENNKNNNGDDRKYSRFPSGITKWRA